jgi:4-amino-4-deoxy-L-arabinose transferase-like glycosyltransferase
MTKHRLFLYAILTLAAALRLFHLDAQSFFPDEAVQCDIARRSVAFILSMQYPGEVLPPLSFLALHFWLELGSSDFWVRLLFALAGWCGVLSIYFLGKELRGAPAGLWAAFLLAISPFHIWYSQDARPYPFLMLFCILQMLFLLKALRQGQIRYWAAYYLAAVCALYSHPFALFGLGAGFLYVMLFERKRNVLQVYFPLLLLVALSYTPHLMVTLNRMLFGAHIGDPKPINPLVWGYNIFTWCFGFTAGSSVAELHRAMNVSGFIRIWYVIIPAALAVGVLGLTAVLRLWQAARRKEVVLLVMWCLAPLGCLFALSLLTPGTYNVRYASEGLLPFVLLLGIGLAELKLKWRTVWVGVVVCYTGFSLYNLYTNPRYWKEDLRGSAKIISAQALPGETIFVSDKPTFMRYFRGSNRVIEMPLLVSIQSGKRTDLTCLNDGKGLWLVYAREWDYDPNYRWVKEAGKHAASVQQYDLANLRVYHFAR